MSDGTTSVEDAIDELDSSLGNLNAQSIYTNPAPSKFKAQTSITLTTDDWNFAEIILYAGSISSSNRRGVIISKEDAALDTFFPICGSSTTSLSYFRPLAYINNVLSFETGISGGVMVLKVKRIY